MPQTTCHRDAPIRTEGIRLDEVYMKKDRD